MKDHPSPHHQQQERAGFISVTIRKQTPTTKVGLHIGQNARNGRLVVTKVGAPGALLHASSLQVGDEIDYVNQLNCKGLQKRTLVDYIRHLTGPITILARNPRGNPHRAECMVEKRDSNDVGGLDFVQSNKDGDESGLFIRSFDTKGIFGDSLLSTGDRVLTVNSVDCGKSPKSLLDVARTSSLRFITLVAEMKSPSTANRTKSILSSASSSSFSTETTETSLSTPTSDPRRHHHRFQLSNQTISFSSSDCDLDDDRHPDDDKKDAEMHAATPSSSSSSSTSTERTDLSVSSATIRSNMNELMNQPPMHSLVPREQNVPSPLVMEVETPLPLGSGLIEL